MPDDQLDQAATWFFATVGPQHLSPDELAAYRTYKRRLNRHDTHNNTNRTRNG